MSRKSCHLSRCLKTQVDNWIDTCISPFCFFAIIFTWKKKSKIEL